MAEMLFKEVRVNGHPISYIRKLELMLRALFVKYNLELKTVPLMGEDPRDNDEITEILLAGQIQEFVPPTPFSRREHLAQEPSEYSDN